MNIADHLKTMTAANGFVPAIANVQIVTSLDEWKKSNRSVAVMSKGTECGVFIHCNEPDSLTEQQLRESITQLLTDHNYTVNPEGSGLPLLITEAADAIADEETDDSGGDRSDERDGGGHNGLT